VMPTQKVKVQKRVKQRKNSKYLNTCEDMGA
jgi:hypothetical protein